MRLIILKLGGNLVQKVRYLRATISGCRLGVGVKIESSVRIDKVNPGGIVIGDYTLIAAGCTILTHDHHLRNSHDMSLPRVYDTKIGQNCFIGIEAFIMPGVTIGNNVIVGARSVVTRDIPDNCIAVGSPCRVIKQGIMTDKYGIIL